MDGFLNKGEISQAAQLAMSVLKAIKAKSPCGNELGILVKIVVGSKIFPHLVFRSGLSSIYLITLSSKSFSVLRVSIKEQVDESSRIFRAGPNQPWKTWD